MGRVDSGEEAPISSTLTFKAMRVCYIDLSCQYCRTDIYCVCVPGRYITILYYLNDVEEGGETAFPVADMKDFNETVSHKSP